MIGEFTVAISWRSRYMAGMPHIFLVTPSVKGTTKGSSQVSINPPI